MRQRHKDKVLQRFLSLLTSLSVSLSRPSEEMVKMVLSRPCHPEDQFTTSILRHWASKYDDTLGEHIKAQLIKNNNQPRKRQRYSPQRLRDRCTETRRAQTLRDRH